MRGVSALAVAAFVGTWLVAPSPAEGGIAGVEIAAPPYADVPAWFVGDVWTYETHVVQRSPNGSRTDTTTVVDTRVVEVRTETVRGTWYTVYNTTTDGTVDSSGVIAIPGVGVQPYYMTGTTTGWAWTDRSNLAVVVTNQTGTASGEVDLPFPLPNATLFVDGATTVTFEPAQEEFDFPLEVNDAWSYNVTVNTTGYAHFEVQSVLGTIDNTTDLTGDRTMPLSLWFNGTEDVTVPAGPFSSAARINASTPGGVASGRWYHADAKNLVKLEIQEVNAPDDYVYVWVNLTGYALNPPPWPGTILLTPQKVGPGGLLTASGTAFPNESLAVHVPAIPMAYFVTADPSGAWSVGIAAPALDDATPANTDVGSHGVIVDGSSGPPGWAVATVQLVRPDLFALDAELTLSAVPVPGIPVDVRGTLHAGANADVMRAFNVSFTVDGGEIQRYAISQLFAGTSATFTAPWTPSLGWHTITFRTDADDVISESDEGNNTATRSVFVVGPDLAPMNVVVESDIRETYPDPAIVGYVSRPAQGRIGGTVNVTVDVQNVGGSDASASFVVEVVETQGLRGPPAGPPVLSATVLPPLASGSRAGPFSASWPVPGSPGVYHLNVTVDADTQIDEESEANNTFVIVVNVSGPDYRIANVDAPPKVTAGSAHLLDITVRNDGPLAGDREVVLAAYEGGAPFPFATATVAPLGSAGSAVYSIPWAAPNVAAMVPLSLVVDANFELDEMIESNNGANVLVDVLLAPITTISWTGANVTTTTLFVTSAAMFTLSATDRSDTVLTTFYRIDLSAAVPYAAPFALSTQGVHTIEYWSEDAVGGEETHQVLIVSVDDSPPQAQEDAVLHGADRWTLTLSATDGPAGVGLDYIEYRIDGGPPTRYAGAFNVSGYGDHAVTYYSVDLLGNIEDERAFTFTIVRATPGAAANWKPFLAAVFAVALLIAGFVFGRKQAGWSFTSPRVVGIGFAAAELATGLLSTASAAMAVPPYGLGLAVDVVILGAGLLAIRFVRPPPGASRTGAIAEEPATPPEPEAGTAK